MANGCLKLCSFEKQKQANISGVEIVPLFHNTHTFIYRWKAHNFCFKNLPLVSSLDIIRIF